MVGKRSLPGGGGTWVVIREEVTSKENAAGLLLFLPVGSGESGDSVRVVRVVRVETLFDGC